MATSEEMSITCSGDIQESPSNRNDTRHRSGVHDSGCPNLTKADVVAFSSRRIAAARAVESRRADRLFNDYFAELLGTHVSYKSSMSTSVRDLSNKTLYWPAVRADVEQIHISPEAAEWSTHDICEGVTVEKHGATLYQAGNEAMRLYEESLRVPMRVLYEFGPDSEEEENAHALGEAGGGRRNRIENGLGLSSTGDGPASRRLAIRTRFGDDFFEHCTLPPKSIKQIVLIGAGMDTRGYRLRAGPGTIVFEVDQALVLEFKRKIISGLPSTLVFPYGKHDGVGEARVVGVEADLRQTGWDANLIEAGFDPALPSAWILEGLTMYLEEDEVVALIQIIANISSPGSAFCANVISEEWLQVSKTIDNDTFRTWKWGSDDPQRFFAGYFPGTWSFKSVKIGTPGQFPDGADYSTGYQGKGHANVIGYAV